jgi:hypothetical protein
MMKVYLLLGCLLPVGTQAVDGTQPVQEGGQVTSEICRDLNKHLSHLSDEKAKSIITAFCAFPGGDPVYIDKLQVTINIQGEDATYEEKYKHYYGPKVKGKGDNLSTWDKKSGDIKSDDSKIDLPKQITTPEKKMIEMQEPVQEEKKLKDSLSSEDLKTELVIPDPSEQQGLQKESNVTEKKVPEKFSSGLVQQRMQQFGDGAKFRPKPVLRPLPRNLGESNR